MGLLKKLFGKEKTRTVVSAPRVSPDYSGKGVHLVTQTVVRFNDTLPDKDDYSKTIFLKFCTDPFPTFPQYLRYECGIDNPQKFQQKLLREGLIRVASQEEVLASFTVKQLKEMLEKENLSGTGRKQDLIKRIIDNFSARQLIQIIRKDEQYVLSDEGQSFISSHEGYVILHRNGRWPINHKEYDKKHRNGDSPYDTIESILLSKLSRSSGLDNRDLYIALGEVYEQAGRNKEALQYYIAVLFVDASLAADFDSAEMFAPNRGKVYAEKALKKSILLPGGIVSRVEKLGECYSPDLLRDIFHIPLPINLCPHEYFQETIESMVNGKFSEYKFKVFMNRRCEEAIDALAAHKKVKSY